jgi:hypothetical protein
MQVRNSITHLTIATILPYLQTDAGCLKKTKKIQDLLTGPLSGK